MEHNFVFFCFLSATASTLQKEKLIFEVPANFPPMEGETLSSKTKWEIIAMQKRNFVGIKTMKRNLRFSNLISKSGWNYRQKKGFLIPAL
jgi:hypothetical protein